MPRTKEGGDDLSKQNRYLGERVFELRSERDALREALNEPNFVIAGPNGDDWFVYRESRMRAALDGHS